MLLVVVGLVCGARVYTIVVPCCNYKDKLVAIGEMSVIKMESTWCMLLEATVHSVHMSSNVTNTAAAATESTSVTLIFVSA